MTNVPILCAILYRCQHKQHQERQVSVATLCGDKAWSVNRLGRIARLHHQPEACVQIINTLYGFNAMEVQEAFVKVREQAKALLRKIQGPHAGPQPHQFHQPGLGQPQHQAETINLKAQFFAALGDSDVGEQGFVESTCGAYTYRAFHLDMPRKPAIR